MRHVGCKKSHCNFHTRGRLLQRRRKARYNYNYMGDGAQGKQTGTSRFVRSIVDLDGSPTQGGVTFLFAWLRVGSRAGSRVGSRVGSRAIKIRSVSRRLLLRRPPPSEEALDTFTATTAQMFSRACSEGAHVPDAPETTRKMFEKIPPRPQRPIPTHLREHALEPLLGNPSAAEVMLSSTEQCFHALGQLLDNIDHLHASLFCLLVGI